MLVHHVVYLDGTWRHQPFSRAAWEQAIRDPSVRSHWAHPPELCRDPLTVVRERFRSFEQEQTSQNSPPPPGASFVPEQTIPISPPPREGLSVTDDGKPLPWGPEFPLTPQYLSEQTDLSLSDCKDILRPLPKDPPMGDVHPMDEDGNPLLF